MYKKQIFTVITLVILLLVSCSNTSTKNNANLMALDKQEVDQTLADTITKIEAKFFLKVSAVSCNFDIQVNGHEVFSHKMIYPISGKFPINQWFQNGENKITIIQRVKDQNSIEESSCEVTLLLKQNGEKDAEKKVITNLKLENGKDISLISSKLDAITLEPSKDGKMVSEETNLNIGNKQLTLERVVSLELDFPKWKYLSSDIIKDTKENRASLYAEYEKIHKILSDKNVKLLRQFMDERVTEYAAASNMTWQESYDFSEIETDALDPEQELLDLERLSDNEFKITGDGKLVELTRWNGKAQIVYGYKDESFYGYYSLIFRKSGNQWVLTR